MFEEAIREAVRIEIDKAVKKAVENAKSELERKIPEIVAGLSIRMSERIRMETLQNELLIHIKMDGITK